MGWSGLVGRSLPNRIHSKTEFYHILQYDTTFHKKQFERKRIGSVPQDTDLKENTYFYIIFRTVDLGIITNLTRKTRGRDGREREIREGVCERIIN
jgi:hypothetical protein